MTDSVSSRLDLLRFLERVQERDLERTRRWIAEEERREAEQLQGQQHRPPPPDWLIEHGLNRHNVQQVHTGECWAAAQSTRTRPVTRTQALHALTQGVPACGQCRPDTTLGLLDS
ncbi:DUF6233 domain-containing protein [Streptomyces tricolor]|uniref:DUF6233 domain-containing protein n=1 Tax=Streptomyces tricolor TaxID=68277 RepID=A0ABS9JRG6_9ACTN|nr:DUF6233 domain-containing protein [Streptomyces tricolor]MCG0068173.1 DUF6233 domain-containing protein [Streptomyces tricolor]